MEIEKPYSIIPSKHLGIGYNIIFDETTNLGWYLYRGDAEKICFQLNSAFQYGFLKAKIIE